MKGRDKIKMGLTDRRRSAERKAIKAGKCRGRYFNGTPYCIRYRHRVDPERLGMDLRHGALANGAFVMTIQNNAVRIMRCAVVNSRNGLRHCVTVHMEDLFTE